MIQIDIQAARGVYSTVAGPIDVTQPNPRPGATTVTTDTPTAAAELIARSISHDEIVTADWSAAIAADLLADCDDSVDTGAVTEYWGTAGDDADDEEDSDAATWRVHLVRADRDDCDDVACMTHLHCIGATMATMTTAITYRAIPESQIPATVRFYTSARNAGQIVEVAYGHYGRDEADYGDPYQRTTDHSTGLVTYAVRAAVSHTAQELP